jgi:hypothetical protein
MEKELVVAHYREDLKWLRKVPRDFAVTVYHKDAEAKGAVPGIALENVGREADTYLTHLIGRWDRLADLTVFCQGHPFDHAHDFHASLRRLAREGIGGSGFEWFGFIMDSDDPEGRRLFVPWGGNPGRLELPGRRFYEAFLGGDVPAWFRFRPGAQFAVSAERIRERPLACWMRLRDAVRREPLYPHCLERLWDRMFGVEAIPEMGGELTRYLKPIRRLGGGAVAVEGARGPGS